MRSQIQGNIACVRCLIQRGLKTSRTLLKPYNSLKSSSIMFQRQYLNSNHRREKNKTTKYFLSTGVISYGMNVRPQKIVSRLTAEQLVRDMSEKERQRVFTVLQDLEEELRLEKGMQEKVPNFRQLSMLAFTNSIPFIGFGFFDNAIMIVAGEYIDYTVGAAFGISTMAAAAIGNMISDVAGIGLAGWVEALAMRLGLEEPSLTPLQLTMTESRIACHIGRAIGIIIGCIIGMAPLLFITPRDENCEGPEEKEEKTLAL